jgi:hypothetical protein
MGPSLVYTSSPRSFEESEGDFRPIATILDRTGLGSARLATPSRSRARRWRWVRTIWM